MEATPVNLPTGQKPGQPWELCVGRVQGLSWLCALPLAEAPVSCSGAGTRNTIQGTDGPLQNKDKGEGQGEGDRYVDRKRFVSARANKLKSSHFETSEQEERGRQAKLQVPVSRPGPPLLAALFTVPLPIARTIHSKT